MNHRSHFLSPDIDPSKPWLVRKRAILKKMKIVGCLIYLTGAIRTYIDGDGVGTLFRWWHPVSWVVFVLMIPVCAVVGERITEVVTFKLGSYWSREENKKNIKWV